MSVLTAQEARVLLEAEWEDIEDADRFLPSMSLWDALKVEIPGLTKHEPMVIAMDAGISSDLFGLVGTTRHWERHDECAVRFVMKWGAKKGGEIDFEGTDEEPGPLKVLKMLRESYNIVMVTYDPYEMRYAASQIRKEGSVWLKEFGQTNLREQADRFLYDLIIQRKLWHDGDKDLRDHISNSDRKLSVDGKRMRLVKRMDSQKIDLAVSLSMATWQIMRLNV
ncbi:MAG: phage terminase family protein, partial [Dehalococcoidales bacterium]|nr:phage terminase family protein [Dehalococcoidales bacterium]